MADDKTRLLEATDGRFRTKKATQDPASIHENRDVPSSRRQYGTWEKLVNTREETDQSEASCTEQAESVQPVSTNKPSSDSSPQEASLAALESSSPPEIATSSYLKASSGGVIKISALQSEQDPLKASFSESPSTSIPSLLRAAKKASQDSNFEEFNSNDHSKNRNATLSEQSTSSTQSYETSETLQNSPPSNTNNEYQRIEPRNTEELDTSPDLSELTNSNSIFKSSTNKKPSSSNNSPLNLKNRIPKSHSAVLPSKLKSKAENSESENHHLFPSTKMEFYVSNGKVTPADKDNDKPKLDEKTPIFVYYLACFATIGGLLFGYDTGIVSGSMLLIKDYFKLSTTWQEIIVSGTVGAAAVFSLFAGFTCDYFGRKMTIMAASVVFVAGAVIMGAAESTGMLLAGRIVVGIGIGFASMTVPVYVAEAAPSAIRGRLVSLNQLFITIGILISSVIAGAFSGMKKTGWRYMLGLAGVPGIIQFIGFLYLPESPRWLVMKGKDEQAARVLRRIRGKDDVQDEIKEIRDAVEEDKKQEGFVLGRVIRTQHVRKALFVGCGLQVFQQLCGINTVIYYSATILKMSGFPSESAIWLVLVPNGINFLSTIVGVALVERLGRRKLTIFSFLGVVIALVVLAVGFQLSANFSPSINQNVTEIYDNGTTVTDGCFDKHYGNCEQCIEDDDCGFCFSDDGDRGSCLQVQKDNEDTLSAHGRCLNETLKSNMNLKFSHGYCPTDYTWMAVLGLALFVMAFAPGVGPMPWTINSEIYPMWARSTCNSLATGSNWICNLLVSLFFLTLTETITKYGAFWLFAAVCFLGMLFTIAFLPETKNKSLEEVEQLFKGDKRGADNLGYEREILPPAATSNTKL